MSVNANAEMSPNIYIQLVFDRDANSAVEEGQPLRRVGWRHPYPRRTDRPGVGAGAGAEHT